MYLHVNAIFLPPLSDWSRQSAVTQASGQRQDCCHRWPQRSRWPLKPFTLRINTHTHARLHSHTNRWLVTWTPWSLNCAVNPLNTGSNLSIREEEGWRDVGKKDRQERAEQKRGSDSLRRWLKDGGKFSGKIRRERRKYTFWGENC